jgi:four helix bundle protein
MDLKNGAIDRPQRQAAKSFVDLIVWQKSHQFVLGVYRYTRNFPAHEIHGLTSQFRRAAVSIAANIAEGFKRRGKPDKRRFLNLSQASLEECRYYLILAQDLNYGNTSGLMASLEEVSKLLDAYSNAIKNS